MSLPFASLLQELGEICERKGIYGMDPIATIPSVLVHQSEENPMEYTHTSLLNHRDQVCIDGDRSIKAVVTAITFRAYAKPLYGVSYVHNGECKEVWVEEWRLSEP